MFVPGEGRMVSAELGVEPAAVSLEEGTACGDMS